MRFCYAQPQCRNTTLPHCGRQYHTVGDNTTHCGGQYHTVADNTTLWETIPHCGGQYHTVGDNGQTSNKLQDMCDCARYLGFRKYPTPGLSNTWFTQHLVYPTPGLSNTWFTQHLAYPTPGLSDKAMVNRCPVNQIPCTVRMYIPHH